MFINLLSKSNTSCIKLYPLSMTKTWKRTIIHNSIYPYCCNFSGKWRQMKPQSGALDHTGLKLERVKVSLVNISFSRNNSSCYFFNAKFQSISIAAEHSAQQPHLPERRREDRRVPASGAAPVRGHHGTVCPEGETAPR